MDLIADILVSGLGTVRDVLPVMVFLLAFNGIVLRRPLPHVGRIIAGFGLVMAGLALFLLGLERGLFPLGRLMAEQLTSGLLGGSTGEVRWYEYHWVYIFAFSIGFGTTIAEPALLAVALKANDVSGGAIGTLGLRIAVALGVAIGVVVGCFRIITGTPLYWYIICGYLIVILQTAFAERRFVPLAYDSGGVTTSTVTVPLITALGLGLSEGVPGRSPLLDGFGLIAFASLFAVISVLGYVNLSELLTRWERRRIETASAAGSAGADLGE